MWVGLRRGCGTGSGTQASAQAWRSAACAYFVLARSLVAHHGADSTLAKALGRDVKGKLSVAIYACAIPLAFVGTWIALGLYVAVALMWLVPDRRFESRIGGE